MLAWLRAMVWGPWRQDGPGLMAGLVKRSVSLAGHRTSLALEPEFWRVLEAMAATRQASLAALVGEIDRARGPRPLASACRLAALAFASARDQ